MGSGSLLLILAAVGVDYGWQPDGTRSRGGGDNLEYIIQIAPDQIGRLQRVGEITSVLDPSISARVTKVVIRVGNGTLPRNAGDQISTPVESTLTPKEPRTGLNNERDAQFDMEKSPTTATPRSATESVKIVAQTASTITSRMKPAEQIANGIDLPSNLSSTITASSEVSTEPINSNRTNQWTDMRNHAAPRNLIVPPPPPTITPSDSQITPTPVANQTQIEAEQPKENSWPPSQNKLDPKSNPENFPTQISNGMSLPEPAVSTSPDDPTWSGYGREPNSLSRFPKENENHGIGEGQAPRTANESKVISTTPIGHQSGDSGQLQRGRINQTPYRSGAQSINNTSPHLDGKEYWVDQYGRKLDHQGNLIADSQPKNPLEGFDQNEPHLRTPTEYRRPEFGSPASSVSGNGLQRSEIYAQENSLYPANTTSDRSAGQLQNAAISNQLSTNGTYHPTDRSLSLEHDKAKPYYTQALSTESEIKSFRRMNAQPFFNFILLISLVGNAYLIYETGNLRRKFRNMLSAIRTTKITPQGT